MRAGGDCAWTLEGPSRELALEEVIEMLEARPERPDPKNPGKILPAHGAAMMLSSESFTKIKTAFEQACALLKDRCTEKVAKETRAAFANIEKIKRDPKRKRK